MGRASPKCIEGRPGVCVGSSQGARTRPRSGSPPEVLVTAPPGYMLRLSEGELDSARFERLVLAAKDMESSAALDTLQEAMSLSQLKKTSKKCPRCQMGIEKNGSA